MGISKLKSARSIVLTLTLALGTSLLFGQACGSGFSALSGGVGSSSASDGTSSTSSGPGSSPGSTSGSTGGVNTANATNEAQLLGPNTAPNCSAAKIALATVVSTIGDQTGTNCIDFTYSTTAGQGFGADSCATVSQQGRSSMAYMNPNDCSFHIEAASTGFCYDSTTMTQQACDPSSLGQTWLIDQNGNGSYQLQAKASTTCLSLRTGSLTLVPCSSSDTTQNFYFASTQYPAAQVQTRTPTARAINGGDSNNIDATNWSQVFGMIYNTSSSPSVWNAVQPGNYVEYQVTFPAAAPYLIIMYYTAWMSGAGVNITVNGQPVGSLPLPPTGDASSPGTPITVARSMPLLVNFPAGLTTIRFTSFAANIPFNFRNFYLAATGTNVPNLGQINAVSATAPTQLTALSYASMYRQEYDATIQDGTNPTLSHVDNQASIEFLISVPTAGAYTVSTHYSAPFASAGVDFALDPGIGFSVPGGVTPLGLVALPVTAGSQYTTFVDSTPLSVQLPAGIYKLVMAAHFYAGTPLGTAPYAFDRITLTPSP